MNDFNELNGTAYLFIGKKADDRPTDKRIADCAYIYAQRIGLELPANLTVCRNDAGKPSFQSAPVHFSVSHSGDIWACVIGEKPLGLDIQQHVPCDAKRIAKRFFHPHEYEYLESNGYREFFDIWVAKESYVKYTGCGIDDNFGKFCVVENGEIPQQINGAYFMKLRTLADYSVCICSGYPVEVVRFNSWINE